MEPAPGLPPWGANSLKCCALSLSYPEGVAFNSPGSAQRHPGLAARQGRTPKGFHSLGSTGPPSVLPINPKRGV